MRISVRNAVNQIDYITSRMLLNDASENNTLNVFLFHGLFLNEKEINANQVHPQQGITVQHFREFIEHFLENEYVFITPDNVVNGLKPGKKYIMVNFDDGYFNNIHALPIIKEYKIPCVIFISSSNVEDNKCFWWDVFYRECVKKGVSIKSINSKINILKNRTTEEIEKNLKEMFGKQAFAPISDMDRPFTAVELKNMAMEKHIILGNHTRNHAILTNYNRKGIWEQITEAQRTIQKLCGVVPEVISYPNGNYTREVLDISKEIGFKLGFTTETRKNLLPLSLTGDENMRLGRFILWGDLEISKQCDIFQTGSLLQKVKANFR